MQIAHQSLRPLAEVQRAHVLSARPRLSRTFNVRAQSGASASTSSAQLMQQLREAAENVRRAPPSLVRVV